MKSTNSVLNRLSDDTEQQNFQNTPAVSHMAQHSNIEIDTTNLHRRALLAPQETNHGDESNLVEVHPPSETEAAEKLGTARSLAESI